jgi:hypothetical protein
MGGCLRSALHAEALGGLGTELLGDAEKISNTEARRNGDFGATVFQVTRFPPFLFVSVLGVL